MVKITKIAVWKVGSRYFEDAATATRHAREMVIHEMLKKKKLKEGQHASWVAANWDAIEQRVKAAIAST